MSIKELESVSTDILVKHGVPPRPAAQVAEVLVNAEAKGHGSHGLLRLDKLITGIKSGTHFPSNTANVVEMGNWLVVDGQHALGPAVCYDVTERCIEIAQQTGVALASLKNITHFGIGGFYTEFAASRGLLGIVTCNTEPAAAPFGGKGKVLGTNPISFACPTVSGRPISVDLATTAAARGKLLKAERDGDTLPDFVAVDKDGNMTNDPKAGLGGSLSPLGGLFGYKGTGLGIMVDILSGCLSGSNVGTKVTGTATTTAMNTAGTFMLFLNPAVACGDLATFEARVQNLVGDLTNAEVPFLPGQKELETYEKHIQTGITITPTLEEMFARLN